MVQMRTVRSAHVARVMCVMVALALMVPVALSGAAPGHAKEADEDPAGDFLAGYGSARGTALSVGPSRSGFNFTTDFAVSLTDYQNTVARADSRAVDLGAILEGVWEAVDEDMEYAPSKLTTDSRDEDAAEGMERTTLGSDADSPFVAAFGRQYVEAQEDPLSVSETAMGTMAVDGAFALEGGRSWSRSGIVDEGQREARGRSSLDRLVLGDGDVVIEGLEWEALHRTGAEEQASASFSLGSMTIGGEEVVPAEANEGGADGIAQLFAGANEALAEVGLELHAPEVSQNEQTGQVQVSPLIVTMGPSELSKMIAGPLMDGLHPVRKPLTDALLEMSASFGSVILLFDVATGAFAGGGEIVLEIGGARAVTGFQEYENPFGDFGGAFGEGFGEAPEEPATSSEDSSLEMPSSQASSDLDSGDMTPRDEAADAPAPELADDTPQEEPVDEPLASQSPDDQQEALAAPAGAPGGRGGQALMASLIALLVAGGLGGADYLRLRQAQRTIPG